MLTTLKSRCSEKKIKDKSQIALAVRNDLVTDDKALAKTFNKFFVNVVAPLGIKY